MSATSRRLAAVVLIALVPRVMAAIMLGDNFQFPDEARYADAARSLLAGDGWGETYRRVPGYPVLLAVLGLPAPASVAWLRLAQALVTAAGAALVFSAAGRLVGPGARLPAALIYALDPLMVVAGVLLYPEASAAVLMLGAVFLIREAARKDSPVLSTLAGSAIGMVALLRPAALAVVPVMAFWPFVGGPARPGRRAMHAGLVVLTCLLVLAPWTWRNYRIHGRFVPVSLAGAQRALVSADDVADRGLVGALATRARTEPLAVVSHMAREFVHFWDLAPSRLKTDDPARRAAFHRRDPRLTAGPGFPRTLRDAVSAVSFAVELLLALAGMVLLWRGRRREAVLLASVVLVYAVGNSLFYGKLRYRITILPLVFLMAGAAASALHAAILRRRAAGAS